MNHTDISLYAILDPNRSMDRDLAELAVMAARGGATIFQYRDKDSNTRALIANAIRILEALQPYGIPLLINDRVDVAMASGAHGVHVGQSDMPAQTARKILGPDAIIGLTIKEMDHVNSAPTEQIDYACIGGVFSTLSKVNPISIGVKGWMELAENMRLKHPHLPLGAIAGIDETNVQPLFEAGVDGVAVISALFMATDVELATSRLKKLIEGSHQ